MSNVFLKRIDASSENIPHETLDSLFSNLVDSDYSPSMFTSNLNLRDSGMKFKAQRIDSEKAMGNQRTQLFYDIFCINNNDAISYNGMISFHDFDAQRKTVKLSFLINTYLQGHIAGIMHHIVADAANLLSHIQYIEMEIESDQNSNSYDYKLHALLNQIGFNNGHDSRAMIMDIAPLQKNSTPRGSRSSKNGNNGNAPLAIDSDNHPKLVCKYFKMNECKWGSRCRFSHEITASNQVSSPNPRNGAKLPDSPQESKIDHSNTNIISTMSHYFIQFLNNASGEWLSYLKHFDVDAKSKNITYISDEVIKKIQECRNEQSLKVVEDVYNMGLNIFIPNTREIAGDKLELLLYLNKEVFLQFERQVVDSKYQVEVEKHIKLSNYLCERLNLLFTRRSPITYSVNPIAYPISAATNMPNANPLQIYSGYGDSSLPPGSPSYYVHNAGIKNMLFTGFMPSSNSNFISHLPTTSSIPIAFSPSTDIPRFNDPTVGITAVECSDKPKSNDNRREWIGKRHKKKSGRRQHPTENNAPSTPTGPVTVQRLNFSQVLQAAEQSQAPSMQKT